MITVATLLAFFCIAQVDVKPHPAGSREVKLIEQTGGELGYRVVFNNGTTQIYQPDEYARLLYSDRMAQPWYFAPLNITSPIGVAWVALGLLGQVLFTGRMIVQWLTSERSKQSVVPVSFWWMSLTGATMLIIYFIWRQDIVGILGQATGWLIYVRNLVLIYKPRQPAEAA